MRASAGPAQNSSSDSLDRICGQSAQKGAAHKDVCRPSHEICPLKLCYQSFLILFFYSRVWVEQATIGDKGILNSMFYTQAPTILAIAATTMPKASITPNCR